MRPDTKIDVRHFLSKELIDKKKNADAAIIAMHPVKNVKETGVLKLAAISALILPINKISIL